MFLDEKMEINEVMMPFENENQLGAIIDSTIENYYNGQIDDEQAFDTLKRYLSKATKVFPQYDTVDKVIDHIINNNHSEQLDGFIYNDSVRAILTN